MVWQINKVVFIIGDFHYQKWATLAKHTHTRPALSNQYYTVVHKSLIVFFKEQFSFFFINSNDAQQKKIIHLLKYQTPLRSNHTLRNTETQYFIVNSTFGSSLIRTANNPITTLQKTICIHHFTPHITLKWTHSVNVLLVSKKHIVIYNMIYMKIIKNRIWGYSQPHELMLKFYLHVCAQLVLSRTQNK